MFQLHRSEKGFDVIPRGGERERGASGTQKLGNRLGLLFSWPGASIAEKALRGESRRLRTPEEADEELQFA